MNEETLRELAARGESAQMEFKSSTSSLQAGLRTVCAFLNGALPGRLIFGVRDDGRLVGQDVTARTLEEIAQELRRIDPPAFPDIDTVELENGRSVIVLRVPGGTGLYRYDGRPYHRVGATTSVMPSPVYDQRVMERMHQGSRWEKMPDERLTLDHLDRSEIVITVEEAIRRQRLVDPGTRDPELLLLGLGLIEDGQLLNAAAVLFGKGDWMIPRYTQCLLRMARFRGTDKTEFIDNRQEFGNAFTLFVRAQEFMRVHLPIAGRIVPNVFERIDDPLYPTEALREALANALCHRDYTFGGGSIGLAIYDDRLEISSPGPLPFGQTPDDLRRPHRSQPWNPLIANAFYRRGIIEQWGRGTIKMIELTEQAGLVAPEWETTPYDVLVRFRPTRYVPPSRVAHDLSALQRELLDILARSGPMPLQRVMGELATVSPRRTVQDNLQFLRTLGLADSFGKGGAARWSLKANES